MDQSAQKQMPKWECHKTVWALKIDRVSDDPLTIRMLYPEDASFAPIGVSPIWFHEKHVKAPGYYVQYEDGYTSWSPVEAFESGYTRVEE